VVGKIDLENANNATFSHESLEPEAGPDDAKGMDNHVNSTPHPEPQQTGYIGMLAVSKSYRRHGIGKALVRQVLQRMRDRGCTSATLETEVSNVTAQKLYQNFGFIREEFLVRYYLNNGDAYRLRLWF
jgi:peptide alpha-N-acetyltransferase